MARGMAASADMWKLAGTGGTPGCTVESEAYGPGPGLLAGMVGTRAVTVAVVGACKILSYVTHIRLLKQLMEETIYLGLAFTSI